VKITVTYCAHIFWLVCSPFTYTFCAGRSLFPLRLHSSLLLHLNFLPPALTRTLLLQLFRIHPCSSLGVCSLLTYTPRRVSFPLLNNSCTQSVTVHLHSSNCLLTYTLYTYSLSQFTHTIETVCSLTIFIHTVCSHFTYTLHTVYLPSLTLLISVPLSLTLLIQYIFNRVHSSYSLSTFTYTLHQVCSPFPLSSHRVYSPFTYTSHTREQSSLPSLKLFYQPPSLPLFLQSVTLHLHSSYSLSPFSYTFHTICHPSLTLFLQSTSYLHVHSVWKMLKTY
jgi:hypothetical protein